MPERCKCGTDAMGGCRIHNASAARVLDGELKLALAARDEARAGRDEAEAALRELCEASELARESVEHGPRFAAAIAAGQRLLMGENGGQR